MKEHSRKSIVEELGKYCIFANKDDTIEVTEWINGEGFDVEIINRNDKTFSLTWGEFKALRKVIKKLEKE